MGVSATGYRAERERKMSTIVVGNPWILYGNSLLLKNSGRIEAGPGEDIPLVRLSSGNQKGDRGVSLVSRHHDLEPLY